MDHRLADQLGRELAWSHCKEAGIVSERMCKEAGLLEGIIFAPLTAIAAMISAPWGSKMRSMGVGLLLGAGMGAVADREVANRQSQGEQVTTRQMGPAMKAIMAGVALGGTERVKKDLITGKPISQMGGLLTGAPLGALLSSNPETGMAIGAVSGSLLSAFQQGRPGQNPIQAALGMLAGAGQGNAQVQGQMPSPLAQMAQANQAQLQVPQLVAGSLQTNPGMAQMMAARQAQQQAQVAQQAQAMQQLQQMQQMQGMQAGAAAPTGRPGLASPQATQQFLAR